MDETELLKRIEEKDIKFFEEKIFDIYLMIKTSKTK
jgi:hypothetical protein